MKRRGVKQLICGTCGGYAPGWQWWAADTGYGICARCFVEWEKEMGREDAIRSRGHPGVHHSIPDESSNFPLATQRATAILLACSRCQPIRTNLPDAQRDWGNGRWRRVDLLPSPNPKRFGGMLPPEPNRACPARRAGPFHSIVAAANNCRHASKLKYEIPKH